MDPEIGNEEDMVSSLVQMFDSVCRGGEGEWALAECSFSLSDVGLLKGRPKANLDLKFTASNSEGTEAVRNTLLELF